jgi:acetyl esterase/lipase
MNRRKLLGLGLAGASAVSAAIPAQAQNPEPGYLPGDSEEFIALWPGVPPGGEGLSLKLNVADAVQPDGFHVRAISQIQQPGFFVYRPTRPTGVGLLIIPGGGYTTEGGDRGGREIAQHFMALGITCFVLRYRLPGEGWANRETVPLQDAQRAMRLIRTGEYGINPGQVGVIGFSAGGHLSATLALRHSMAVYENVSTADGRDARPSFAVHMYPVITMGTGAHPGSRDKLLGPSPSAQAVEMWSLERHAAANVPPSFICLAADDDVVPPVPNGIAFFRALREVNAPAAMHVFEKGGHGFSLHWAQGKPCAAWPDLMLAWAASHGFRV